MILWAFSHFTRFNIKTIIPEMNRLQQDNCKGVIEHESSCVEMETFIENKDKIFDDGLGSRWKIWRRRRNVVVIIIFFGFFVKAVLRSNMTVAVFPMTENYTITNDNGTKVQVQDFDWDVKTRGFLLSVFYYGYVLTNIAGGVLAVKYGGANVYGYGVLLTSLTTLLTPVVARIHLYALIALRISEGIFEGILDPGMEILLSRWIPLHERSSIFALVVSGSQLGHAATVAASSAIGFHCGWEAIFYCTGSVGILWFVALRPFLKEHPTLDNKISRSEHDYIQKSCTEILQTKRKVSSIPFVKILTSGRVWGIILPHTAVAWCYSLFITQSPAYIKDVLKFDYKNSAYLSSLPFIIKLQLMYLISPFADILPMKNLLTITATRKLYICGSLLIIAMFGFLIQLITSTLLVLVCITLILVGCDVCHVQLLVNVLDIAPRYSSVLVGLVVTTVSLGGIITPTVTGYLTQNKTAEEWHTVFSIQIGICLLGSLAYGVFGSGQLQPWAIETTEMNQEMRTT